MTVAGRPAVAHVDLLLARGADFDQTFRWNSGDPAVPVDLTGWSARAQLRRRANGDLWTTLDSGDEITLGGSSGTITLHLSHTRTESEAWDDRGTGVWDLELTNPAGHRTRLLEGVVTVSQDVTRDA